jgi:hypothetical protein
MVIDPCMGTNGAYMDFSDDVEPQGSIVSRGGESHAVNGHDKQATADVPAPPRSWSLSF